jgi:hypothetical protein
MLTTRLMLQLVCGTAALAIASPAMFCGSAHAATVPNACQKGYVWRMATPDDHVCVTPQVRAQAQRENKLATSRATAPGATTCKTGFVLRAANTNDKVCGTAQSNAQAQKDNAASASRLLKPVAAAAIAKVVQGGATTTTPSTTTPGNNPNAQCTILSAQGFGQVIPVTINPPPTDYTLCKAGDETGFVSASVSPGSANANAVCQITAGGASVAVPYYSNPAAQLGTPCTILGQFNGTISRTSAKAPVPQ